MRFMLNNKRLEITLGKAIRENLSGGVYILDCYNNAVVKNGVHPTITARTSASNNTFLLDIYEEDSNQ